MTKITHQDFLALMLDPESPEEQLADYVRVGRGKTAFRPVLRPDPDLVEMGEAQAEAESAMELANRLSRLRREIRFHLRLALGDSRPVLVSEGDSWFQFPLLIREVIDRLGDDYLIWSLGAAGDTAENMAFHDREYLSALRARKDRVRAFLFSGAGNDILGEDTATGAPVLLDFLRPFNGDAGDVAGHVDRAALERRLRRLRVAYRRVIGDVRAEPDLARLPIVIHGYDYCFPYPWGADDDRDPAWADRDEWLGGPMAARGIVDDGLRRGIVAYLVDALYDLLLDLAGDPTKTGVWVVDCRGAMPERADWIDEIHGTSEGFAKVADRFRAVLAQVLGGAG